MRKYIFFTFLFLIFTGCIQRVVHEHKVTEVPQTPFKALVETSDCYTDRATFKDNELKPEFIDSTAVQMAQKFGQSGYEKAIADCVTTNGTGRKVVVFMCPAGTEIKDHYCNPL
jgi:hypothetical protein